MSDNPARYNGKAILHVSGGPSVLVEASLSVDDSEGVRTWGGRAISDDLAVLALDRCNVVLYMLDGSSGEAWIPNARIEPEAPGVVVRVQGAGDVPPWWSRPAKMEG